MHRPDIQTKLRSTNKNLSTRATGCNDMTIRKEMKMVNTSCQNDSFMCVENIRETRCEECELDTAETAHPLKQYLHDLWINIRLFFETDKWEHIVTLKMGDSHYTIKMEDIESRWRNR